MKYTLASLLGGIAVLGLSSSIFASQTCYNHLCVSSTGLAMQNAPELWQTVSSGIVVLNTTSTTGTTTVSGSVLLPTPTVTTGILATGTVTQPTTPVAPTTPPPVYKTTGSQNYTGNSELDNAIRWGHYNGLTLYNSTSGFNADHALLREDASKLFFQAARTFGYKGTTFNECTFKDIATVSDSLKQNISDICKTSGLMKGHNGEFFPFRKLTKAEALTVLARITGIQDSTSLSAWWTPYLTHMRKFGILSKDYNETTMDHVISRGELIVLLHKLAKLYDKHNGDFQKASIQTGSGSTNSNVSVGSIVDTPRFTNALLRMYHNNMTIYWKASEYDPFNVMTKEQAAKVLATYYKQFIKAQPTISSINTGTNLSGTILTGTVNTGSTNTSCTYSDIARSSVKQNIEEVCQFGIFAPATQFYPTNTITKSDFVKAILAMQKLINHDSTLDTVIAKALEVELITSSDLLTFDKPITRYEVALMLHTLYLKHTFISNLNTNKSLHYVISPLQQLSGNTNEQLSLIDINTIDSKDFNNGYINLFNQIYKINKKEIINHFPTSYSWHGTINDIATDNTVGNITLSIGQKGGTKVAIEGYIIFQQTDSIYTITPTPTIPYYMIKKIK